MNIKLFSYLALSMGLSLQCLIAAAQFRSTDYQVAAKDAAWCWFSDPRAVYYKAKHEKIYYSYINSRGDVLISSRDLKTKHTETFILHKELQIDDHNVPSILFLPDGKILAFYTEHNGRFFMRKSKNPEDIGAWEETRIIPFGGNRITYSHPVMLNGEKNRIYMFWRGSDWRPSFAFSDDLGETWSQTKALIESTGKKNRPYLKVCSDDKNRIDFTFTDGHPAVEPTNSVYHFYYEKGMFYQTNGQPIRSVEQLPIAHSDVNKVYDGTISKVRGWISDISLNEKKQPVIVYTRYPQDTDHRYHYVSWNGKKWQDEEICKAGGWMPTLKHGEKNREPYYSGGISLDHESPSNVYLSREINGVFELEHWKKAKRKWAFSKITSHSESNNVRPFVVSRYTGKVPIVLWMFGLYNHYTNYSTDLLINEIKP